MPLQAPKAHYTFADCLAWDESTRIEIIHGEAIMMSMPLRIHQEILGELSRQLANFLEGKRAEVIFAPFAVRLFEKKGDPPENVDTVVLPDISVICDHNKLDEYGCKGAPDMVVEILSPSTQRHDQLVKLRLYQQAGVQEYWIVDPENQTVRVMLMDEDGRFQLHEVYGREELAKVNILDGCFIELAKVFPCGD